MKEETVRVIKGSCTVKEMLDDNAPLKELDIDLVGSEMGITLSTKKYKGKTGDDFLHVEIAEGELRVCVWADPNEENWTHSIIVKLEPENAQK